MSRRYIILVIVGICLFQTVSMIILNVVNDNNDRVQNRIEIRQAPDRVAVPMNDAIRIAEVYWNYTVIVFWGDGNSSIYRPGEDTILYHNYSEPYLRTTQTMIYIPESATNSYRIIRIYKQPIYVSNFTITEKGRTHE